MQLVSQTRYDSIVNTCPVCKRESATFRKMLVHVKKHGLNTRKLYTKLNHNGVEPTCSCGCGGHVRFMGLIIGFEMTRRNHPPCKRPIIHGRVDKEDLHGTQG